MLCHDQKDWFLYFELELLVEGCDMFIQVHVDVDVHQIGVLRRSHGGLHCESHEGVKMVVEVGRI